MDNRGRIAATGIGAVLGAPFAYFTTKLFEAWGVLDDLALRWGTSLKTTVTPAQAGWTVGFVAYLALMAFLWWVIWHKKQAPNALEFAPDPSLGDHSQQTQDSKAKPAVEIDEVDDIEAHRNIIGDTGGRPIIKIGKAGKASFHDNRIGNFNAGVINGDQIYNEVPTPRTPPDFESAFEEIGTTNFRVQVRVYGMDHEMRTFGGFIIMRLRDIGVESADFGHDAGTQNFSGVIVKSFHSERSQLAAQKICDLFVRAGIKASHEHTQQEVSLGFDFIRIGVGSNG